MRSSVIWKANNGAVVKARSSKPPGADVAVSNLHLRTRAVVDIPRFPVSY